METCQLTVSVGSHTDTWHQGFSKTFVIGWKWECFSRLIKVSHCVQLAAWESQRVFNHILYEHSGNLEQQPEPMHHERQCLFWMPRLLPPVIADLCLRPLPEVLSCRNPCPKKANITYSMGWPDSLHAVPVCCRYSYWKVFKWQQMSQEGKKINQPKVCHYLPNFIVAEARNYVTLGHHADILILKWSVSCTAKSLLCKIHLNISV